MFTGIIKNTGKLKEKSASAMVFEANLAGVEAGESIAVNGACLTVVKKDAGSFGVDVSSQTLRKTALGSLRKGETVNLERAMKASDVFGGHMVTGHVDGVGKLTRLKKEGEFTLLEISVPAELAGRMVDRGSVAVDGISLTAAGLGKNSLTVTVIPHTLKNTNLCGKKPGDLVNIELDIIGKYVENFLKGGKNSLIDEKYLRDRGF